MRLKNTISIIIPVWNEANNLKELLPLLIEAKRQNIPEVLVIDGGSTDESIAIAKRYNAKVLSSTVKSRAVQLNLGAKHASGEILFLIHADTRPLASFKEDILLEISNKNEAGCYRYKFDSSSKMLKINSWFTRFNGFFSGGGDQTLFITTQLFNRLGGYDERFSIMEDFDLVRRIKRVTSFKVIPKSIKVSARKYESNSWPRVQLANSIAMLAFYFNSDPEKIKGLYSKLLNFNIQK